MRTHIALFDFDAAAFIKYKTKIVGLYGLAGHLSYCR